jgi:hypothetical protein
MMNHVLKTGVEPVPPVAGGLADGVRDNLQGFLDNEAEELAAAMVGYRYLYDDFRDESVPLQLSSHGAQITIGLKF